MADKSTEITIMRNFVLIVKIVICVVLAFVLVISAVFVYKNYSYSEKQRLLWNGFMGKKPVNSFSSPYMSVVSGDYDHSIKDDGERRKLKEEGAPDWNVLWPEEVDLNNLSFGGMTEAELLSLPRERKSYAYYQELIGRFTLDPEKISEIISDMKSIRLPHADFFGELCVLSRRTINSCSTITDFNCKKMQGYEDFKKTVLAGNYEAYALFLFLNKNNDVIMERELLKILEEKANKGDAKSQRELASLLFMQEERNFSYTAYLREWDRMGDPDPPVGKFSSFFEKFYKKIHGSNTEKFIGELKVIQRINRIQDYYKMSAESGDSEAMYLWINQKLHEIPYLYNRSEWSRIKKYYDNLVKRGDWRIYRDLNLFEKNYFNDFPSDYYSHESIIKLIESIEKSPRRNGSIVYLTRLTKSHDKFYPVDRVIDSEMESFVLEKLSNLKKISKFHCYFSLLYLCEETTTSECIRSEFLESLECSAGNKNPHAQYILACIYEKGVLKKKDLPKSSDLLSEALALCNESRNYEIYMDNTSLNRDSVLVQYQREYVPLSYAIPRKFIELNLSKEFSNRNPKQAFEAAMNFLDHYFVNKTIFVQLLPCFEYYLGKMYESGEGVPKDVFKAETWYKKGLEKGNPPCALMLGNLYENGGERIKNKEQALFYYKKASEIWIGESDQKLRDHIKMLKAL